jgi:hypothetical protein
MQLSQHKDLKMEIRSLPEKEKDKLLLRLIAKDKVLTEHLHFKLIENEDDLAARYAALRKKIDEDIAELQSHRKINSKETLSTVRSLVGAINHHYKVTRNENSDVELRLHLLNLVPLSFNEGIFSPAYKFNEKLSIYFVKTAMAALVKFRRMHEDLQYDMNDSLNSVLTKIYSNRTSAVALELGLPKEL